MTLYGEIIKLFSVKPDGWFACLLKDYNSGKNLHVSGVYHGPIDYGIEYDIEADKSIHPRYGEQYKVVAMTPHIQLSESQLVAYLSSDSFPGVGEKTAQSIVDCFGVQTLDVIRDEPDLIRSKLKLSERIISVLVKGESSTAVENMLRKKFPNISQTLMKKILDTYCDGACRMSADDIINKILNNPYSMLYDLPNVQFQDIDKIAISFGYDIYDHNRIYECYRFALYSYTTNTRNVFLNTADNDAISQFYFQVLYNVGYPDSSVDEQGHIIYSKRCLDAVNVMFQYPDQIRGIAVDHDDNGNKIIYIEKIKKQEDGLAQIIGECLLKKSIFAQTSGVSLDDISHDIDLYERRNPHIKFDPSQRTAITVSLMFPLSIINGGPGHGKTAVVDCILDIFTKHVKKKEPFISAPTGRAVSVLKKMTSSSYGVDYKAFTAMRLIRQKQQSLSLNKNEPDVIEKIEKDFSNTLVILDECSMLGIGTAYEFMSLFRNCQFVFVGDVDQLPSIEYGKFFRDMCECPFIMKTELTVNHRSNGRVIIDNAKRIHDGDTMLDFSNPAEFEMRVMYNDYFNDVINEYICHVRPGGKLDKDRLMNTCILCPMNKYSTGVQYLNYAIREILNPVNPNADEDENGYEIEHTRVFTGKDNQSSTLRVGDRVIYMKNRPDVPVVSYGKNHKKNDDTEDGIFNGDAGTIIQYNSGSTREKPSIMLKLDDGKVAQIFGDYMRDIMLSYAMTIHKSQGSEYDFVILSMQHQMLNIPGDFASRNLLYTAITRAKERILIIGNDACLNKCIQTPSNDINSMLSSKIKAAFDDMRCLGSLGN